MIAGAIAWVQARAAALSAVVLAVLAVIGRMFWLKSQRDQARTERDNAENKAQVELERREISDAVDDARAELKQEQQQRAEQEEQKADENRKQGGSGRTGLDNKW